MGKSSRPTRGSARRIGANGQIGSATLFGAYLKQLRLAAGLNQRSLAAAAGVTQQSVSRLELGLCQPTWETACRLARALGTDVTAFVGGEG